MVNKTEIIKLLEELEQFHDEEANNYNDELLNNPVEYRKLAYERANGIRDCIILIYDMDDIEAIPTEWIKKYLSRLEIISKDNILLGEEGYYNEIITIEKLLSNWEEENGIS